MSIWSWCAAAARGLAALLIVSPSARGQADTRSDTVVLRVTSPREADVVFSGVVTLKDAKTERRLDNVRTPFELRLPAQDIDARFTATDGGALAGEIIRYTGGRQHGHVAGQMYSGTVLLYFAPGNGFGFGARRSRRLTP